MLCDGCIHKCGIGNGEGCKAFMPKISEEQRLELLEEIRFQNLSITVFCGDNNLKSKYIKKMIYGKMEMTYKIYTMLMDRLLEKEEWEFEEKRFEESCAI